MCDFTWNDPIMEMENGQLFIHISIVLCGYILAYPFYGKGKPFQKRDKE